MGKIIQEHKINPDGSLNTNTNEEKNNFNDNYTKNISSQKEEILDIHFRETYCNKYTPRCILTDCEPGIINSITSSSIGKLFNPDRIITGNNSTGNNYALGNYKYVV